MATEYRIRDMKEKTEITIETLSKQIETNAQKSDQKFEVLSKQIAENASKSDQKFDKVFAELKNHDQKFDKVFAKFEDLTKLVVKNAKISDDKIDSLAQAMTENFDKVYNESDKTNYKIDKVGYRVDKAVGDIGALDIQMKLRLFTIQSAVDSIKRRLDGIDEKLQSERKSTVEDVDITLKKVYKLEEEVKLIKKTLQNMKSTKACV